MKTYLVVLIGLIIYVNLGALLGWMLYKIANGSREVLKMLLWPVSRASKEASKHDWPPVHNFRTQGNYMVAMAFLWPFRIVWNIFIILIRYGIILGGIALLIYATKILTLPIRMLVDIPAISQLSVKETLRNMIENE